MSRKTPAAPVRVARSVVPRKPDPRVVRSRDALGDALVDLMHEQPFASITVRQLLDRAHVARSTFYAPLSRQGRSLSE